MTISRTSRTWKACFILCLVTVSACSKTKSLNDPKLWPEILERTTGHAARITLDTGRTEGFLVRVRQDSTSWQRTDGPKDRPPAALKSYSVATSTVQKIVVNNPQPGVGAAAGAVMGLILGGIIGRLANDQTSLTTSETGSYGNFNFGNMPDLSGLGVALAAIIGGATGGAVGAIIGNSHVVVYQRDASQLSK